MRLNSISNLFSVALLSALSVQVVSAQTTITGNKVGSHGGYTYEYWKDAGTGTMELKDGGNFSCTWSLGDRQNILFRKGLRPGTKNAQITYSAVYNPTGNSYLSCYGWTKNPLVEYYIVESWGTWRPPGGSSKGTVTSDGGTYDIYQTTRTNAPSIEGTKTFQQYWSVRKTKQTTGVLTCGNHFSAWATAGMQMGAFYEVSFKVEGYGTQTGGSADVTMSMNGVDVNSEKPHIATRVIPSASNSQLPVTYFTILGQKVTGLPATVGTQGSHGAILTPSNSASGVYYTFPVSR